MSAESKPQSETLPEPDQPSLPPSSPRSSDETEELGVGGTSENHQIATGTLSPNICDGAVPKLPEPCHTPTPRKFHGRRKKNPLTAKQRAAAELRLKQLNENFHPLPFSPGKALDFSAFEHLFRTLGIWDFAHLDLDRELQSDLLIDLIAYYDPANRRSYVHEHRVAVSRSDLARALCLPVKKDKVNHLADMDSIQELLSKDETIGVLFEFMSNYMPYHYGEDMCILPPEIIMASQVVKEGMPQKVDWAALMWVLVEKELLEAPKSGICRCASHLQCLIKHQQPHLFLKEQETGPDMVLEVEEEEVLLAEAEVNAAGDEINVVEERVAATEEDVDSDDNVVKMRTLEDLGCAGHEKHIVELGLTLGDENAMNDLEGCKVADDDQWPEEGDNETIGHCLQRCNSKAPDGIDFENLAKEDGHEREEDAYADEISAKFHSFGSLSSSVLLQSMGNTSIPYAQQLNSFDPDSSEFLNMGIDSDKGVLLGHGQNSSLYSNDNAKRKPELTVVVEENHNQHKRVRNVEPWGNQPSSFDECFELIQDGAGRAKVLFAEKEQAMVNMQLQIQYLNHMLQLKDQDICSSKRLILEEQQHWQMTVRHYEHELTLMTQMLLGYKKALKETRSKFADYRKMHPQDEETLYKDVPGTGGLVLSETEFEKHRVQKEEEVRQELLGIAGNFEGLLLKFEEHLNKEHIVMHNKKLGQLTDEVKRLKNGFVKAEPSRIDDAS
ncbi:hypothetical protein HPP92_023693 [Vanilla planifolia]|uniref:Uncharacterized protein n=1 Tax=Vanilla planifolia TaxID=51239 RepID=A0A835UC91_VANPL|nr:hypothetical protein HPP92_024035 [Vanilla planifolia]KAG0455905.1 hypothetical protein HPP92_023693 [Vanilla planifolia]